MRSLLQNISRVFFAGALGGFVETLVVWMAGLTGLLQAIGVDMAPALSTQWIYSAVVWGGLWGFLFVLPLRFRGYLLRGLLFSLAPTAVQLLVIFPVIMNLGFFGHHLGMLTPAVILIYNAVWGITASAWLWRVHNQ
jgi:hypothetical protein